MLYTYNASVTKVIDGDTFICDVDLGFSLWIKGVRIRLLGYNAPESKGKEKEFGVVAKAALSKLIYNNSVILKTTKIDDFGRYLGEVYLSEGNINVVDSLIAGGYGVSWDGKGVRPSFDVKNSYPLAKKN